MIDADLLLVYNAQLAYRLADHRAIFRSDYASQAEKHGARAPWSLTCCSPCLRYRASDIFAHDVGADIVIVARAGFALPQQFAIFCGNGGSDPGPAAIDTNYDWFAHYDATPSI
jgi:hypothetical protein